MLIMKIVKIITVLALCLWGFFAITSGLHAADDADEGLSTVTLIIEPSFNLGISDETVSEVLTKNPGAYTAFDDGFIEFEPDKPTLKVSANKTWKISAKSSGFTGPYAKAMTDLQFRDTAVAHVENGFEDFKALSADDQEFASDNSGASREEHPCQYKILIDYERDIPGTYEAAVTFTLVANGE